MNPYVLTIVGPTATGKTRLSIELAKYFSAEILSADSRQVYRGFDIGSGKVLPDEQSGIPHHLLDILDPWEEYSVQDWKTESQAIIENLHDRNTLPIVVGGTGLYTQALTQEYAIPEVPPNPALRAKLESQSISALQSQIQLLAPNISLNESDRQNPVRLIRTIEKAMAGITTQPVSQKSPYKILQLGLTCSPERLKQQISRRVDERLENGVIDEVQELYQTLVDHLGPQQGLKKLKSFGLGTVAILDYIHERSSWDEMRTKFITKEYQYAKRQLTWFKKDHTIQWTSCDEVNVEVIISQIETSWPEIG